MKFNDSDLKNQSVSVLFDELAKVSKELATKDSHSLVEREESILKELRKRLERI